MLVLTREQDQTIQIGPDVRVVVVAIGRGKVRLGIEAPDSTVILRGELPPEEGRAKYAGRRGGAA